MHFVFRDAKHIPKSLVLHSCPRAAVQGQRQAMYGSSIRHGDESKDGKGGKSPLKFMLHLVEGQTHAETGLHCTCSFVLPGGDKNKTEYV